MNLVYCAGGNRRFYEIATVAGFRYGSQLPETTYGPLWFADQDWRAPRREAYMAALAVHRPVMATVLDWEQDDDLPLVLDWAEEAAQHAERVVIIPKVMGQIGRLPRRIGGREIVLGYSVPTKFAGTELPLWEFAGWPVHLLGGSPRAQMRCWAHLSCVADIVSADGNMAQKLALQRCQFYSERPVEAANVRHWPTLTEADGRRWSDDGPYEAFRRSCEAIMAAWQRLTTIETAEPAGRGRR